MAVMKCKGSTCNHTKANEGKPSYPQVFAALHPEAIVATLAIL